MRFSRGLAALAAAFFTTAVAAEANAFCRSTTCTVNCEVDDFGCKITGKPLFWRSACVGVSLDRKGTIELPFAEVSAVLDASLQTWSNVRCEALGHAAMAYLREPNSECHQPEYNPNGGNANTLMFDDDHWRYVGNGNTLAYTTVTFDPTTGEIFDADIEVNSAENQLTVGDDAVVVDLQSILTHELGHAIGLAHSSDPDATMNATYVPGSTSLRDLAADDIAAVCNVYPPNVLAQCNAEPRGGFSPYCAATDTPAPAPPTSCAAAGSRPSRVSAALVAALFALAIARRRAAA